MPVACEVSKNEPTITEQGLMLAGVVLAKMGRDSNGRPALVIDGDEEGILARLALAYDRPVGPAVLGNIRRASENWCNGETILAAIDLALGGLSPLADVEAATLRLSLGEKLLATGLSPRDLLKGCGLDPAPLDALKAGYNPAEPRIPAGNARQSGEWTDDGGAEGPGYGPSTTPRNRPTSAGGADAPYRSAPLHGYATVYDDHLSGIPTATGEIYDPKKMTGAVFPGTIPLGSVVTVTLDNDPSRSVDVLVNDHGLYQVITHPDGSRSRRQLPGRVIDLSSAAFQALTGMRRGKVMVTITVKHGPAR
jgi:hypothetical protein